MFTHPPKCTSSNLNSKGRVSSSRNAKALHSLREHVSLTKTRMMPTYTTLDGLPICQNLTAAPKRIKPTRTRVSPFCKFNPPPNLSQLDFIRFDSGTGRSDLALRFVRETLSAEAREYRDEGFS